MDTESKKQLGLQAGSTEAGATGVGDMDDRAMGGFRKDGYNHALNGASTQPSGATGTTAPHFLQTPLTLPLTPMNKKQRRENPLLLHVLQQALTCLRLI